jgi:hypothetical protein
MIERGQIRVARPPLLLDVPPLRPFGAWLRPATNSDTGEERKKLQQLSGIKVVVDGKSFWEIHF